MKLIRYISLFTGILSLASCSGFLDEYSQDTDYARSWKDLNETLIGDCYQSVVTGSPLSSTGDNDFFIHFMGDEIQEVEEASGGTTEYDAKERVFGYYTWQQRVGQNDTYTSFNAENGSWTEKYKYINVANNIIYAVQNVPQKTDDEKLGVLKVDGEARFLRAYYYFWLVNLYGKPYVASTASTDLGVPIKTSENVEDKMFQRNTVQEVYDLIVSDLLKAEEDLAQVGNQPSIYRADVTAVRFLLSRVYLYMQNWDKASEYAAKVIEAHPALATLSSQLGQFLYKSGAENIFSMGGNSLPCYMSYAFKGFQVSDVLYKQYADNDLRKNAFFWKYNDFVGYAKLPPKKSNYGHDDPTDTEFYYYSYWLTYQGARSSVSDKFLFRSAEAYLTKAEADAYRGKEDDARKALNTLRATRFSSDYQVSATGKDLVDSIRTERTRELALEGQRWFDIRRYSVCEKYPESTPIIHRYWYYTERNSTTKTECHVFTLEPNDKAYVMNIPQSVLDYNTGMENNERPFRKYTVTK